MRDPNRIGRILNKIHLIWKQSPDLRLGQLLVGLVGKPSKGFDIFGEEDETLEKELDKVLAEKGVKIRGGWRLDE